MASNALTQFQERLKEIGQLLAAHKALVRFRKAESAIEKSVLSGPPLADLKKGIAIFSLLLSEPGPGRPKEVHALNNAAIALLSGHFQGFIVDLFKECAATLLADKVKDIDALINVSPTKGNPNKNNINNLFATLGFPNVLDGIKWSGQSNSALQDNLKSFNELRNRIVHGKSEKVRRRTVSWYFRLWTSLAKHVERAIGD